MKEIYQWVDWFEELANKIAENDQAYLVDRAKRVVWTAPSYDATKFKLFKFGEENVDPFSFIYTLASSVGTASLKRVFTSVTNEFEVERRLDFDQSENCFIFPTPPAIATLFHSGYEFAPSLLWSLFESAVRTPDSVDETLFNRVLAHKGIGVRSITQALFLVSPRIFFPIDEGFSTVFGLPIPKKSEFNWSKYQQFLTIVKNGFPQCAPFEANMCAYLLRARDLISNKSRYFQVTLDDASDDQWQEWKENNCVCVEDQSSDIGLVLTEVKRGDLVLVRQSPRVHRGIGIVLENDYSSEYRSQNRLHVVWMNKQETMSEKQFTGSKFSSAEQIEHIFRNIAPYQPTFAILDRFVQPKPVEEEKSTAFPLNQILFGPPGTGKTWNAEKLAVDIIDGYRYDSQNFRARYSELCDESKIEFVTFHQNYAYEDFIEGIRPRLVQLENETNVEYELKDGIFKTLCQRAVREPDMNFVLIIDEINRGNIAKIFGELITLIERSRRLGAKHATRSILPSSGKGFGVPKNLYIIGTMNTADRSIQLLDTALRRRFHFVELMPDHNHRGLLDNISGIDIRKLLMVMNERIALLLDREHQIGHTYFLEIEKLKDLANTFKHRIFPLLQEYFFDDWSKINTVLGNNEFVERVNIAAARLGKELDEFDEFSYERISLTDERWTDPSQYQRIYETDFNLEQ